VGTISDANSRNVRTLERTGRNDRPVCLSQSEFICLLCRLDYRTATLRRALWITRRLLRQEPPTYLPRETGRLDWATSSVPIDIRLGEPRRCVTSAASFRLAFLLKQYPKVANQSEMVFAAAYGSAQLELNRRSARKAWCDSHSIPERKP